MAALRDAGDAGDSGDEVDDINMRKGGGVRASTAGRPRASYVHPKEAVDDKKGTVKNAFTKKTHP